MSDKLISVIVPVYNVENYIRECLDSILVQTIDDFELLLIDDGATDNSGNICDEYEKKDNRIKVIHKENGGLSSARNRGIDEAKGEYICFIDSDDTVRPDYLQKLYEAITDNDTDIAVCDIEAPKLSKASLDLESFGKITSYNARQWLYDDHSREYVLMVVAWNKLYRASLFDDVRYPVGRLHEDEFVILPILKKCAEISFVPEKLYVYRDNENGITSSSNSMNVRHLDGIDALTQRIQIALSMDDRALAVVTLKNALYKCARFYKDSSSLHVSDMEDASFKKYKNTYYEYKYLLNVKQSLKYRIFLMFPKLFIRIYNP